MVRCTQCAFQNPLLSAAPSYHKESSWERGLFVPKYLSTTEFESKKSPRDGSYLIHFLIIGGFKEGQRGHGPRPHACGSRGGTLHLRKDSEEITRRQKTASVLECAMHMFHDVNKSCSSTSARPFCAKRTESNSEYAFF